MKILGIESSCDETAAAVVEDGYRMLSNVVHTQIDIHAQYGGVIPEVAARSHIEMINPVIEKALTDADCMWDDIDAIAVTYAPGLIGSLLVGTLAARTLAILHDKPLYPIHHVEAHVYANFVTEDGHSSHQKPRYISSSHGEVSATSLRSAELASFRQSSTGQEVTPTSPGLSKNTSDSNVTRFTQSFPSKQPEFPMLALIVSGGHSQLVLFRGHGDYELLGQTQDDAVGEAFDKVAKIIGLPYPGGPAIANMAADGDSRKYQLPKAHMKNSYDFSFSGLKTAVLRLVQREVGKDFTFPSHELPGLVTDRMRADVAASFQRVAVETLVDKAEKAYNDYAPASVVIAGGVAANQALREELTRRLPLTIEYAPMQLCTDNAVMIATLGCFYAQGKESCDPYELEVVPSLSMSKTAWAKQ